jgi:peptidoglycan/xylan/chitin deacetylase (PgdA/CDA1 family)
MSGAPRTQPLFEVLVAALDALVVRALLREYNVAATLNACGRALALSPWVAADAVADGHEVSAPGWRWERHAGMDEPAERSVIARAVEVITRAGHTPPMAWHTRSSDTRRLLVEYGGFLYDSDAYDDDLPYVIDVVGTEHDVLPYAFDTNDMRFFNAGGFVLADDFARYCIDAFGHLYAEAAEVPRMMSVGVHLRIVRRPGRIAGLRRFVDYAASKPDVWFARRDAVAHAWRAGLGFRSGVHGRFQPHSRGGCDTNRSPAHNRRRARICVASELALRLHECDLLHVAGQPRPPSPPSRIPCPGRQRAPDLC